MAYTRSYRDTLEYVAELAPSLDKPGEFIRWAEQMSEVIAHIYLEDYDKVTEDLTDACKNLQDYEEDDEE